MHFTGLFHPATLQAVDCAIIVQLDLSKKFVMFGLSESYYRSSAAVSKVFQEFAVYFSLLDTYTVSGTVSRFLKRQLWQDLTTKTYVYRPTFHMKVGHESGVAEGMLWAVSGMARTLYRSLPMYSYAHK